MSFVQPYIAHVVISPAVQRTIEEASGFKQGPLPETMATTATGSATLKRAIGNLAESIEDSSVVQTILMIVLFIVLVSISSLLGHCS